MRYDAVFLDVDGTLLWVNLDVDGYVEDLSPYRSNGAELTAEEAAGPVWGSLRRHIKENIEHRTEEDLAGFKRRNAELTARDLGIAAPTEVLTEVASRRISFNPYPESEAVLEALRETGVPLYVVSNWDIELEKVLDDLDWTRYFDGVVASAVFGVEKPRREIFEEALRMADVPADRAVMVGNDPVSDVRGAYEAGIDVVYVDRKGDPAPEATYVLPDLRGLPEILGVSAVGEPGGEFDGPRIERAVREILLAVGVDPDGDRLAETPRRVAGAYKRLFSGLREDPERHLDVAFDESARDLILMKDVPFVSMCEHHLLPMIGRAHAAYLPDGRVIGFSEIVGLVEGFAARPQIQERITAQVADALHGGLGSRGSVVVLEAEHTCMAATGAWKPGVRATTSAARGVFTDDAARRGEVLALLGRGG